MALILSATVNYNIFENVALGVPSVTINVRNKRSERTISHGNSFRARENIVRLVALVRSVTDYRRKYLPTNPLISLCITIFMTRSTSALVKRESNSIRKSSTVVVLVPHFAFWFETWIIDGVIVYPRVPSCSSLVHGVVILLQFSQQQFPQNTDIANDRTIYYIDYFWWFGVVSRNQCSQSGDGYQYFLIRKKIGTSLLRSLKLICWDLESNVL